MEVLKTAIEFVKVGGGSIDDGGGTSDTINTLASTSSSSTGDTFFTLAIVAMFCFVLLAAFVVYLRRKNSFGAHSLQAGALLAKSSVALIALGAILLVAAISFACISAAQAKEAKALHDASVYSSNTYNIEVPNVIKAVVNVDDKTVTIPDGYIANNETNQKFQLKSVTLEKQADEGIDSWVIQTQQTQLYRGVAGKTSELAAPIELEQKSKLDISYCTGYSFETALSLVGKTAVIAQFNLQRYVKVTGSVLQPDGMPLFGATVTFASQETTTDLFGQFIFILPGTIDKATAKISSDNYPDAEITIPKLENDDITLDPIVLKGLSNEPKVLDTKSYNGKEQIGVEADDTVDLSHYAGVDAGDYEAQATPAAGYAFKDGSTDARKYPWKINKADSTISVHDFALASGGESVSKTFTYNGDQSDISAAHVSFNTQDTSQLTAKLSGTPQSFSVVIACAEDCKPATFNANIKIDASKNYNEANASFKVVVTTPCILKGQVSGGSEEVAAATKQVRLILADEQGYEIIRYVDVDTGGNYAFSALPTNVSGRVSCTCMGYTKTEDVAFSETQTSVTKDLALDGPYLDAYSLDELSKVSDDISAKGKQSRFYSEFTNYINDDSIWFSQSNNMQPDEVKSGEISNADPKLCNQDYKNNFEMSTEIPKQDYDICNFMFLRVIGINQDQLANSDGSLAGKTAGLTFQTIRSLPRGYSFQDDSSCAISWWGDERCGLRNDLNNDNGLIYSNLANSYKTNLVTVQKKAQQSAKQTQGTTIKTLGDKLFCLSYTEMANDTSSAFDPDYYNNGAEGAQYMWYSSQNIAGNRANEVLENLGQANNETEMGTRQSICYQRTPYFGALEVNPQFLTVNHKGKIFTYSAGFNERNGIAPAFCLGSYSGTHNISLKSDGLTLTNLEGTALSNVYHTTADTFSFKVKLDEGAQLEYVKADGVKLVPSEEGVYTVSDITADVNIEAKASGGTGERIVSGTLQNVKNIGDNQTSTPMEGYRVKLVAADKNLGEVITGKDGAFSFKVYDESITEATLKFEATPGTLSSELKVNIPSTDLKFNVYGLDFYTIPELSQAGDWLSEHEGDDNLKESACYKEFMSYIEGNCVWYSNSNGKQPNDLTDSNPAAFNANLANQDYKCFFEGANQDSNSQYLYLRLMDILHDDLSSGDGHAGFTFQTVHSLPVKTAFGGKWWQTSELRKMMQRGGSIFDQMPHCNLTDYFVTVNKYSSSERTKEGKIETTKDKLFAASFSELCAVNNTMVEHAKWYDSSGNGTEGRLYAWYKAHNIDGGKSNDIILHMHWNNDNIQVGEKGATWQRSAYYDNEAYSMLVRVGTINSFNYDTSGEGIAPMFCLGSK